MTAFAQGEFPAAYADFTVDHRDAVGAFVESLAVPSETRAIYQLAFDPDGNLWGCDNHGFPTNPAPYTYPDTETDPDIEFMGGGRILKWKRDGSLDTAWALTPAGKYSTDLSNLWPKATDPSLHNDLLAPFTVCPISTGLLVGESLDQAATVQNARLKLIDYETGTVIRTYGHFDVVADTGTSMVAYWLAVDEAAGVIYFVDGGGGGSGFVQRYDMVNDVLLSALPFSDKPALTGQITAVRINSLGQIVFRVNQGGASATYTHGMFFIKDTSGTTLVSKNLNDVMLVDTASIHERIVEPGGWGCDVDYPTRVWFSARQINQATSTVDGTNFYHVDLALPGGAGSALIGVAAGGIDLHYAIGLPDGSFRTAYPGLARYRPDGSRVWLRSHFE